MHSRAVLYGIVRAIQRINKAGVRVAKAQGVDGVRGVDAGESRRIHVVYVHVVYLHALAWRDVYVARHCKVRHVVQG